MTSQHPILVTGAAGKVGAVGRLIVEQLRNRDLPVRAMVYRDDERAEALRAKGAEVVIGDLTKPNDVVRVLQGCKRVYFGMSVSPPYLEATVIMGAAALELGNLEVLVNMSQMSVSEMSLTKMTESPQQRLHWLAEQTLNWSGLPVVHVRPTVFLDNFFFSSWAAESIAKDGTLRLPFGKGRTSPIAAEDVARVVAAILESPSQHIGKVHELTGAKSRDMTEMAKEYSEALGRKVTYVDEPNEKWVKERLETGGLPEHVKHHIGTMARLHADGRYDRFTDTVEKLTGTPAMTLKEFIANRSEIFKPATAVTVPD